MPTRFKYDFLNTRLVYEYNTLSILDFTDKELEESNNPFATVILVAKKALLKGKNLDGRLLDEKLMIARLLKEKGFSERKIAKIMVFLNNYVQFEKPEMNRIFGGEVDKIFGKKSKNSYMGIVEVLAEMRAAEEREITSRLFVQNLLKDSDFTQAKIASLANVSLAFVRKVKKGLAKK